MLQAWLPRSPRAEPPPAAWRSPSWWARRNSLVERAVARLVAAASAAAGAGSRCRRAARTRRAGRRPRGRLAARSAPATSTSLTAPSLFGGGCVVVIRDAHNASKDVDRGAGPAGRRAAAGRAPGRHPCGRGEGQGAAGQPGRERGAGDRVSQDHQGVRPDGFRAGGVPRGRAHRRRRRRARPDRRARVRPAGDRLRLRASWRPTPRVSSASPWSPGTTAGRAEASGFSVADRAVEGRLSDALELLRWALAVGVAPVLISSGLGAGVRLLGRVSGAPRGQGSAELAAEVGAPPWKIDRVRQQLRGWEPDGIARALGAVAEADAQVKGRERALATRWRWRSGPSWPAGPAQPQSPGRPPSDGQAWSSAARLAIADLRFAAWFLWMTPLLAALSRLRAGVAHGSARPRRCHRRRLPRGTCARWSSATT